MSNTTAMDGDAWCGTGPTGEGVVCRSFDPSPAYSFSKTRTVPDGSPCGFILNVRVNDFRSADSVYVIHGHTFDDDRSLNHVVRRYVRRYNRTRLHSSLGYRSPINYERNAA